MKITKKTATFSLVSIILAFALPLATFAEEAELSEQEAISLPDVSTVISGGAPKAGKSAVPDFSDVLISASDDGSVLPRLPDSSDLGDSSTASADFAAQKEKDIYLEGLAGAGWPGFVTGQFSVYRQSGKSPFKVSFAHESANGYSGNSLTSGYSDRNTSISAQKDFLLEKNDLHFTGFYNAFEDGLQNQVSGISGVSRETLGAAAAWDLKMPYGFAFGLSCAADWYKRYATITGDLSVEDYARNVGLLDFSPSLYFSWGAHGFYSEFTAEYSGSRDLRDSFYGTRNSGRGDFGVNVGWKNKNVHLFAGADAVVGNRLNDNDVIVPFVVGSDFSFLTNISSRSISIGLKGGIDSELPTVRDLEQEYRFSALQAYPVEISDWFGKANLTLPVKDKLTVSFDGEFRKTAYDNGSLHPDYDTNTALADLFGQYVYIQEDMTQFNTELSVDVNLGLALFSAAWNAYWIDVPCNKNHSTLTAQVSLQDKNARFGLETSLAFAVDPDDDNVPFLNLGLFWRLTPAVRLAVNADDIVKLISSGERTYAGEYICRSGTASLAVRFFF